jgi:hypothetical protein
MSKDPKPAEKVTLPTQKPGSGEKDSAPAPAASRESRTATQTTTTTRAQDQSQSPKPDAAAPAPDPRPEPAAVNVTNVTTTDATPRGGDPNNGTVLDQEKAQPDAEKATAPVDGAGHAIHDPTGTGNVMRAGDVAGQVAPVKGPESK